MLYELIFKRVSNLYLLFKLHPALISDLTLYYKGVLHALRQSQEHADQQHLAKLIAICPHYIALVCEYYQTLKNTNSLQ